MGILRLPLCIWRSVDHITVRYGEHTAVAQITMDPATGLVGQVKGFSAVGKHSDISAAAYLQNTPRLSECFGGSGGHSSKDILLVHAEVLCNAHAHGLTVAAASCECNLTDKVCAKQIRGDACGKRFAEDREIYMAGTGKSYIQKHASVFGICKTLKIIFLYGMSVSMENMGCNIALA